MKKYIYFYLLIVGFILLPTRAYAENKGLGIYPPIITVNAKPPSKVKVPLRVKNLSDSTQNVQLSLRPFILDLNGNVKLLLHKDYTTENSSILSTSRLVYNNQTVSNLILSPHQEQDLTLMVDVEAKHKSQDFYFSILIQSENGEIPQNSYSLQKIGATSNILLSIGDLPSTLSLDIKSPFFITSEDIEIEAKLKNISDRYVTAYPRLIIKNLFGNIVEIIDLQEKNILPNQEISYGSKDNILISNKKYLIGPYKAILDIDTKAKLTGSREVYVIVVPFKQILYTFIVIFVIMMIVSRIRKRSVKLKANIR